MAPPRVLTLPSEGVPDVKTLDALLEVLRDGGLAALPTETVYGLAARADRPAALAALAELKGRGNDAPFTLHAAGSEGLGPVGLPRLVQRLTERYWPGPLTLVIEGVPEGCESIASNGWTGVRVPAFGGTRAALAHLPFPVVMTSVNVSGAPPACDAATVVERFGDHVPLVLDGGTTSLQESSSVLAIGHGRFELLRLGLLDGTELARTAGLKIGFACTGNTCRSPLAEFLSRRAIAERLGTEPESMGSFGFHVNSAGVHAGAGAPMSEGSMAVLQARDLDGSTHTSHPVTPTWAADLDRIYALTSSHAHAIREALPPARASRVELLLPDGQDVPDPYGAPVQVYEATARIIESAIELRLEEWVGPAPS
jgi:L-threonylcarbamoyladenylate synthase